MGASCRFRGKHAPTVEVFRYLFNFIFSLLFGRRCASRPVQSSGTLESSVLGAFVVWWLLRSQRPRRPGLSPAAQVVNARLTQLFVVIFGLVDKCVPGQTGKVN